MNGNQQGVQLIESEEDQKKKAQATQPGSAFAAGSAPSSSLKGGQPPSAAPTTTQQARAAQAAGPTRGTGFTGVGRFLQANVGSRLGQEVAGRVSRTGQEAAARLGQSVGQFQQQRTQQQQERTKQQEAAQSALQRIASGELTAVSPEQQAAYQAIAGGQFGVSGQLQDIGGIQSQARLAGQLARGTQTAAGRTGLLQQVVGRGPSQYTSGQSALDALILGQAGGQLAAARRASAGLERQVGTQEQLAAEQARQFGAETQRAKEQLTGERTSELGKISSLGEQQKKRFETEQDVFYNKALKEIEQGVLSPETAAKLFGGLEDVDLYGFTKEEVKNLLQKSILPTYESSLTAKQAAAINALKNLAGESAQFTPQQLSDVIGKTSQTGYLSKAPGVAFDPEGKIKAKADAFYKQKQILDDVIKWAYENNKGGLAERLRSITYGDVDISQFGGSSGLERGYSIRNPLGAEAEYVKIMNQLFPSGEVGEKRDIAMKAIQEIAKLGLVGDTLQVQPPSTEEEQKNYDRLRASLGQLPVGPKNYPTQE